MNRRTYGLLEIERTCWVDGRVFRPGDMIDLDAERHPQAVLAAAGSAGRSPSSARPLARDYLSDDPLDYL
jgi:hypothetical protein